MTREPASDLDEQYRSFLWRKIALIIVLFVALFIVSGWAMSCSEPELGFFECYGYIWDHIIG